MIANTPTVINATPSHHCLGWCIVPENGCSASATTMVIANGHSRMATPLVKDSPAKPDASGTRLTRELSAPWPVNSSSHFFGVPTSTTVRGEPSALRVV